MKRCRTLCGCVDWNSNCDITSRLSDVAPYVGAWIETSITCFISSSSSSHPMWVRGLKPLMPCVLLLKVWSRTLCGCVDWNIITSNIKNIATVAPYVGAWIETGNNCCKYFGGKVAPYVGAWIETLDYIDFGEPSSRTLCGCVDWNKSSTPYKGWECVAPYVGAWIET